MQPPRLSPDTTAVLAVDLQEKLLPIIRGADTLQPRCDLAVQAARVLNLPVLATEQYPEKLGVTALPALQDEPPDLKAEKMRFSACLDPIQPALRERGIQSVLLIGIETHVCVLQTALDLLQRGWVVALAHDAVGTRRAEDHEPALQRMRMAGAVPTTVESALMEMTGKAGTDTFRQLLKMIK